MNLDGEARMIAFFVMPRAIAFRVAEFSGLLVAIVGSPWVLDGWASMAVNCAAIFLTIKQLVWHLSPRATRLATMRDRLAFSFLWPGMDVAAFLGARSAAAAQPPGHEYLSAAFKVAVAAAGMWMLLPLASQYSPALVGVIGMLGAVLLIHCGLFHALALAWQASGRTVKPIMNAPLTADSLADFWSRRWNLAFRDAAALVVFRPTARRWGVGAATFATFLASGLVHDAAISLPARGGYGLPTLYFLLQYVGMMFEHRYLRGGTTRKERIASWLIAVIVIVLPLPLLFHPLFAENVIAPILKALRIL